MTGGRPCWLGCPACTLPARSSSMRWTLCPCVSSCWIRSWAGRGPAPPARGAGGGHGELCEERLRWLDRTLAEQPGKPTLIGMHHPPFQCGIDHMDRIALRNPQPFLDLLASHKQVQRIVCGHHHRPVTAQVGGAIASICPSVAHQVELDLEPAAAGAFVMEPPAYQLHRWRPETGVVSHTAYVESYPGPFPFLPDPDYPGKA